jgi:hypothetical protein
MARNPRALLAHPEDRLLERKLESDRRVYLKAIVAFANSVEETEEGVLLIGVQDDGTISGVGNTDSLQRKIRTIADQDCYPPVAVTTQVISAAGRDVVAVFVPHSPHRPHFAGAAYVRVGAETKRASKSQFEELVASRTDPGRQILAQSDKVWLVRSFGRKIGDPQLLEDNYSESAECRIEQCTPHYVRLINVGTGQFYTESLEDALISHDEVGHRPMLVVM